ncbi:minor capsid protein [Aerococcus urinaeequi]|uniref:minor capsid protein n=1 Tax=Aerococcus urinaeequi TaxID=51665 RepID=UPI003D6A018B
MNKTKLRALQNRQYNAEREAMDAWAKRDLDIEKLTEQVYQSSMQHITDEVDAFYLRYANRNGVSIKEARKRADTMDVTDYFQKAYEAVRDKDFSDEAEEWLRVYNLKMSTSRLELEKAKINLELLKMYSEIENITNEQLEQARLAEIARQTDLIAKYEEQAGILGNSVGNPTDRLKGVVNADFYGANFNERIWSRNGHYASLRKELFKSLNNLSVDMMGYRKERNRLMKVFNTSKYESMRLIRTEHQRVNMKVQHEMAVANDFTHYTYVAESGACPHCARLAGKSFKIEDYEAGVTAPLLHPNCRCSVYHHIEMAYTNGKRTTDDMDIASKDDYI